jgi:enoyl-CoA hydratase/carnithine racemase
VLDVSASDGITVLRMDRPPANGLNRELVAALLEAVVAAPRDGHRGIVLTGRDGMFSAGLDVPEMLMLGRPEIEQFWRLFFSLNRALASSPVPVLAAVSGHAPAGGAVLALHCDWRVGVRGKFRMGLNEVQVGLPVPRTILIALTRLVGPRSAAQLATRGDLLSMEAAAAAGLLDELVEPVELLSVARQRLTELLALPPAAMNLTRLGAKAELLAALEQQDDAPQATAWWFSDETQRGMQQLAARLGSRR